MTENHEEPIETKPRLRLFLSIDLVGSTSFKQTARYPLKPPDADAPFTLSHSKRSGPWLDQILSFYSEFNMEFAQQWAHWQTEATTTPHIPIHDAPEFWKGNGDELLFTLELKHPKEVFGTLVPWVRAVRAFRTKLRVREKNLDVKATAWLAGFPINNSEIVFENAVGRPTAREPIQEPLLTNYGLLRRWYTDERARSRLVKDYIGPSIDTGFRLSAYSTPRKFVISIDVALLLSHYNLSKGGVEFAIHFDGKESLKGVIGGRPYPILWIDLATDDELSKAEDKLRHTQATNPRDVKSYCQAFLEENAGHLMRPFFWKCEDESEFNEPPENYAAQLDALIKWLRLESDRREREVQSVKRVPSGDGDVAQRDAVDKFVEALKKSSSKRPRRRPKKPKGP